MYMTCRHIKTNGLPCESPALKNGNFCYYHSKIYAVENRLKCGPVLPLPEDSAAIQISIARINEAILNGWIDLTKARSLFSGLRIAAQFINRGPVYAARAVQSPEQSPSLGYDLAPQNYVCDDDEDCNDCPVSDVCPRCIHSDDDDESSENKEENRAFEED